MVITDPTAPDMESAAFLTNKIEIENWLDTYCEITGSYTITPTGKVNVDGNVRMQQSFQRWQIDPGAAVPSADQVCLTKHFKVAFGTVTGNFICNMCEDLLSLAGAPEIVGDTFDCSHCWQLRSLLYAPKSCITFECSYSAITSLRHAPVTVENFYCNHCTDLQTCAGAPEVVRQFECEYCHKVTNTYGLPKTVEWLSLHHTPCRWAENEGPIPTSYLKVADTQPSAAVLRQLLCNKTEIDDTYFSEEMPWIVMVNRYHATEDLLTAMEQFEDITWEPFIIQTPTSIDNLPSL